VAGRTAHVAAIGALLLAGCGATQREAMPAACSDGAAAVARALERAPDAVTLADGTPLSGCVRLAREADLQSLGVVLTRVADDLRERAASEPAAALRLGYLVGAVRRGARATPGIASQLARRIDQVAAAGGGTAAARTEVERGIRLGEAGG